METFHECTEYAAKRLADDNVICSEFLTTMFHGGVSYGETRQWHFPVERICGKFSNDYFHFIVSRDEYGRYEAVCYCL